MKKRIKTVITAAMIAALGASLLTGCGSTADETASTSGAAEASSDAAGGDSDSILIAGIAPLTGSLASWGEGAINGYNLAIKEINEAGGVTLGDKTYTLESAVFADDKSDATEAISAYNNCASYDISAVIGSCSSSCTLSFVETAQDSGMLVITPYSTNATICKTGDYIFRECFSDADQGPTLAKLATEEFGAKNIAIVAAEDSDYCAGLAEAMEGALADMSDVTYETIQHRSQKRSNRALKLLFIRTTMIPYQTLFPRQEMQALQVRSSVVMHGTEQMLQDTKASLTTATIWHIWIFPLTQKPLKIMWQLIRQNTVKMV